MNTALALLCGWLAALMALVAALALRRPFDEHAATVTALLRPDDPALPDDDAQLIAVAVDRAVDQYASYLIALRDGMPAGVVASLREQMYGDLRDSLAPAQLARALVIGLHPHADDRARALLDTDDLSTEHLES